MSNKKNKLPYYINRRQFLHEFGLTAGLAIPFLRSQIAMGQSTTAPVRVLFVPLQHGWGLDKDVANYSGTEFNFTLPPPFNVFNSIRNQTVFVDGLRSTYWGNAHDVNYSDILTSSVRHNAPNNSAFGGPFPSPSGPSLDHVIASHFGKNVLRLSANYTSWGANHHPVSFDATGRRLPYFTTALDAYRSVIDPLRQQQNNPPTQTPPNNTAPNALLNQLGRDADRLLRRLTGTERTKMEGYLESLNSLGDRILSTTGSTGPVDINNVQLPNSPGNSPSFSQSVDAYFDMIRVAFTLDTHRVAVLGLGQGVNNWSWTDASGNPRTGNPYGNDFHHEIAHYDRAPSYAPDRDRAASMAGWTRWYGQKVVNFVNNLSSITDVDGRALIENTIIVLCGEVGNGNHDTRDMSYVVIGGGGQGRIRRNRWLKNETFDPSNRNGFYWGSLDVAGNPVESGINYGSPVSTTHVADLWTSIARLAGLNISSFGLNVYNNQPLNLT